MSVNLLEFIKTLPIKTHKIYGVVVGIDTIYHGLGLRNEINSKDVLEMQLIELEKSSCLKIYRDLNGVIDAVSI